MMTTAVLILVCTSTPALSDGYTWDTQKGPDGSWNDPNHWSPEGSYPIGQDDGASIDNDPSVASTVTYSLYSGSNVVNWIRISANQVSLTNPDGDPDRLNLYGNLSLVASSTDDPPLLDNDGLLYLDGALYFQEANYEADYGEILGSGVLRLGPSGSLSGTFSNGPGHVIEGRGRIGFQGTGPVVFNRGVIQPKLGMLRVSGTVTNTPGYGGPAVLRGDAEMDSCLHFDGATVTGGSIEAAAGSVTMEGSTFSNLTISNGILRVIGTIFQSRMGRGVYIAAGAELRLQGNTDSDGTPQLWVGDMQYADLITIRNEGVIALDGQYSNGSAELKVWVPDGQSPNYVTFAGSGSLLLGLTDYSDTGYSYNILSADPGAGYIQLENHSILGYGDIRAPLINLGRITAGKGGTLILQRNVTNANLTDSAWREGPFGTLAATPGARLLIAGGAIVLLGNLQPDGGTIAFSNGLLEQTSWGPGEYQVPVNGVLQLSGVTTMETAAELTVVAGYGGFSKLEIYGGTDFELVNNGEIAMDNSTELRQRGNDPAILSGNGTIRLGVAGFGMTTVNGNASEGFINGPDHTIRGAATFYTNLVNQGEVIAENGYLTFSYPFELSGPGNVQVLNGSWLSWSANLGAHDLTLNVTAGIWPDSFTPTLVLSGNFSFSQTDEYKWVADGKTGNPSLTMTTQGDTQQTVEVGGKDFGEVKTGFNGYGKPNFDLNTFTVSGASTRVQLVDAIDNGNRATTGEALYARTINVSPGAVLDLNCLALYTMQSGIVHKVLAVDDALFGGGDIIDTCGSRNLTDAIHGLQVLTGSNPAGMNPAGDVNDDDRIGLEEVLYHLEEASQ
jgi:hypothetical protein